ncbi:hypothetical protein [Actinacidiphila acididurans]|uniref:MinD-like ATPase involved in chromosome partitioning or flagellar assembly n=1 Tax=Actinacidiphila acididurans TaxID=2784346 RepID=A0ABS2TRX4_9ACTN|nr:hypothetical protein [Actinacidiphila acididurans]MBM9505256.1 hypothetical protein [Actinacidiphila acididurans]
MDHPADPEGKLPHPLTPAAPTGGPRAEGVTPETAAPDPASTPTPPAQSPVAAEETAPDKAPDAAAPPVVPAPSAPAPETPAQPEPSVPDAPPAQDVAVQVEPATGPAPDNDAAAPTPAPEEPVPAAVAVPVASRTVPPPPSHPPVVPATAPATYPQQQTQQQPHPQPYPPAQAQPQAQPRPYSGPPTQPHPQTYAYPSTTRQLPASPNPVPAVDQGAAAVRRGERHGDSVVRRAGDAVLRLVAPSGSKEVAGGKEIAQAIQQPVNGGGRQIAVTSIRGGAGKTTVAALLGLMYAHYRPDPVLSVEADAALGTLPARLGADTVRWTCADLAHVVTPTMQFMDITGYLLHTRSGGWLLPGSQGQVGARLDIPAYRKVTTALRRWFGVTVVDCESLPGELARTAIDTAQARVLVAPATVEGVNSTRTVLDWMAGVPHMLQGTVVVLNAAAPHPAIDVTAATHYLAHSGVTVLTVPHDRHLAAGGPVRMPLLARATRESAGHLAATLLTRANGRAPSGFTD